LSLNFKENTVYIHILSNLAHPAYNALIY